MSSEMGTIDTGAMVNSWYIGGQEIVLKNKGTDDNPSYTLDTKHTTVTGIHLVGNNLEVEIGNAMEYSSHVEYGHGTYKPRYIMTISVDTINRQMPKRFEKAWKKFLKDRGVG